MNHVISTKNALVLFVEDYIDARRMKEISEQLKAATGERWVVMSGTSYVKPEKYLPKLKEFLKKEEGE